MNVRPDQLQSMITKNTYPVYMVSGDEPLQQMETLDLIRAFLRKQDYSEREILDVDRSSTGSVCWMKPPTCRCLPSVVSSSCAYLRPNPAGRVRRY